MADKIGVLGEVSGLTVGTHTVYTCPTGKAARAQLFYRGTAGSSSGIKVNVNGIEVMLASGLTSGHFIFSSRSALYENTGTTAPTGVDDATTVAPAPAVFWLSAGDTVTYEVTTAALSAMLFQVVGSEIDVV